LIHDAKTPCGIGLLIHVGAFQMNTTHLQSAVPKPGGSDLRKQDPFKGKNTTICRGLTKQKRHMVVSFRDSALQPFLELKTGYR
jgi:hypothetical protein